MHLSIHLAVEFGYQNKADVYCTPFLSLVEAHEGATSCGAQSDRGKEPCFAVSTVSAVERQISFLSYGDIC